MHREREREVEDLERETHSMCSVDLPPELIASEVACARVSLTDHYGIGGGWYLNRELTGSGTRVPPYELSAATIDWQQSCPC